MGPHRACAANHRGFRGLIGGSSYAFKDWFLRANESTESKGFTRESNLLSEYIHPSAVNSRALIADPVRCLDPSPHFHYL